jgi:hypothetical protein
MGPSRVYQEHRRVLVGNPTTRNPLLTLNTVAIVGFVGFYGSVGTTNMKWSAHLLALWPSNTLERFNAVLYRRKQAELQALMVCDSPSTGRFRLIERL